MDHNADPRVRRGTFLSVLLTLLLATAFHLVLFALCGGLAFYVLAVVAAVAGFGLLHYFLWGRSLNIEVEGEREEEAVTESLEIRNGIPEKSHPNRRI